MDANLTMQEEMVLLGARDGLSYQEIAASMDRSKARVQQLIAGLIGQEYLEHTRYTHRSISLTDKARKYLKDRRIDNGSRVHSRPVESHT